MSSIHTVNSSVIYIFPIKVFRPRENSDGLLHDICDGALFKKHPLFGTLPDSLQLITYFDEVEVCNPLAGHAGVHKLGKNNILIPIHRTILETSCTIFYLCRDVLLHSR